MYATVKPFLPLIIFGGALLGSGFVGYRYGVNATSSDYDHKLLEQALGYAEGWKSAVETANKESEAQRLRDVAAAEARGKRSMAAREVIHEIHMAPAGPEWTPDERLRLERLYAAHGFNPNGTPAGVPNRLPVASKPGDAPQ